MREALLSGLRSGQLRYPWSFTNTLMRREVKNLDMPVNPQKYLPLQTYVSLFKDYAEAL